MPPVPFFPELFPFSLAVRQFILIKPAVVCVFLVKSANLLTFTVIVVTPL